MRRENQKKHNKVISVILVISMLFTVTFISFAEDGIGELTPEYSENQNEVIDKNNGENENTENQDNEENQETGENPRESSENTEESSSESNQESEENKDPEKDLNNIFDGFDFGKIDIGKVGEILSPIPKENEENKDEGLKENPDENSGEGPKEDQNSEEEIKTENSNTENQDFLFNNIGDLFDKIKDYIKVNEDDKIIEEIKEEINLEKIDMTVQCDELFFTVTGKAPAGTILKVEKLEENFEEQITEKLEESKRFNQLAAFDIKLIKPDGSQFQPIDFGEKVKISVVGLAGNVFRIENEEVTDMQAEFSDEETEFETEHFTTYVIGGVTHTSTRDFNWLGLSCSVFSIKRPNDTLVIQGVQNNDDYAGKYGSQSYLNNKLQSLNLSTVKNIIIGNATLKNCQSFFENMNLNSIIFENTINTDSVLSMERMFKNCRLDSYPKINLENLKTQNVRTMEEMFCKFNYRSNLDLRSFDFGEVKNMNAMFLESSIYHLNLGQSKTEKLENIRWMFYNASNIVSVEIQNLKTDKVKNMDFVFMGCSKLSSIDGLSKFNTENVTSMIGMFGGCEKLGSINVSSFNTEKVSDMRAMFSNCSALFRLDLSSFKISNKNSMQNLITGCDGLYEILTPRPKNSEEDSGIPIGREMYDSDNNTYTTIPLFHNSKSLQRKQRVFKEINGTNYKSDFYYKWLGMDCYIFSVNEDRDYVWVTGEQTERNIYYSEESFPSLKHMIFEAKIRYAGYLFRESNLKSINFTDNFSFDSSVTSAYEMFRECTADIDLGNNFDTSNFISMERMFYRAGKENGFILDLGPKFYTNNVTNMEQMFAESAIVEIEFGNHFDTSNVVNMDRMFFSGHIKNLDLSFFNTENCRNMCSMFYGSNIEHLNISNFKIRSDCNTNDFISLFILKSIKTPRDLGGQTIKIVRFDNDREWILSQKTGKLTKYLTENDILNRDLKITVGNRLMSINSLGSYKHVVYKNHLFPNYYVGSGFWNLNW